MEWTYLHANILDMHVSTVQGETWSRSAPKIGRELRKGGELAIQLIDICRLLTSQCAQLTGT